MTHADLRHFFQNSIKILLKIEQTFEFGGAAHLGARVTYNPWEDLLEKCSK